MASFEVKDRLLQIQQGVPALRLYALVDGAQYRTLRGEPLQLGDGMYALFTDTPDAALAHAGPWLVDAQQTGEAVTDDLVRLEKQAPAVTWLMAVQDLWGLAQLLQLNLNMQLPDGRTALLRFWDPRVLVTLADLLGPEQSAAFFAHIHEWHLLHNQQRVWIGRPDARAQ
jgi:hypothetical protein